MDKRIDSININTKRLMAIRLIALVLLALTSLPGLIMSIIFTIAFIFIKVNKLWFCAFGAIVAFVVNLKVNFVDKFGIGAIKLMRDLLENIIFKNSANVSDIYKSYVINVNILWQVIIAFIVGSIIAEIYYSNSSVKKIITNKSKEKNVKKSLEKLKKMKHNSNSTIVGADYDSLDKVELDDASKHVLIAGTTGAGKTVTISNFIESGMQKGYPIFAVDGKGDLDKGSLLHYMQSLSKKYNRTLYVINFVLPEISDYYNPFRGAGMTVAKDMLIGMNDWTEPHYKVNTERYLQQLVRILNMNNIALDLKTIIKYSPSQFQLLIEEMKDKGTLPSDDYRNLCEIIESTAGIVNSAMARFATTAESEAGVIFNSKGVDIYTALKENANILIILDSLGKPELSKQVGRLAILDAKKAVSKLFGDKKRKFFILDECNVYMSDVAVDLLNKSRSANVTCFPSVQSLSDFDKAGGVALRNQVIENCNNYIIMRQNSPDSSREWERVIGEQETINYSYNMEEKIGLFGNKNKTTGNGNMYKTMESKINSSVIQNLQTGECILLSKDQRIEKKIKVRTVKLDMDTPILGEGKKTYEPSENIESIKYTENNENYDFSEIEKTLNKNEKCTTN